MTNALPTADEALKRLRETRVVPVIVIDDPDDAVPLARALAAGGLACAEITFRTPRAAEALRRIAAEVPEMFVGAGTVLTPEQAKAARQAGAQFIVAPGFGPRMVEYCLEQGLPVYPGICTPTEVEAALEKGLTTLKFFPAEQSGGLAFLKAIAGPYVGVNFMPTGGINASNVGDAIWRSIASWRVAGRGWRPRNGSRRSSSIAFATNRGVRWTRRATGRNW